MKLSEIKAQQQNVAEGKVKKYLLQIAEKSSREKFIAHAAKYGMDADAAGNFWDDTHGVAESSDDIWGPQGNFAGDKHINVGSVSMKNIQAGDTVKYLDQKVKVVAMSKDRKYSRIDIPSGFGGTTKDVLTSDLKQLGQGVAEMNIGKRKPQPDTYHIVNKDGTPISLMCYLDKDNAIKDRDAKHKGAEVHQVGPRGKVKGVAEGSDNLNYIGNCTDDDVIEHIFGDATNFAQAVEEHGDEFTIGDLVVKYDPESDVHSFYYKKQGVAEGVTSPEIKQAYNDIMKTQPGTPERKAAVRKYLKLRADALERSKQGVAEGYQLDEGAIETITALVKKIPGIGKYYQMAQQYKPQLIEILKTSKSGKEVKQKMEQLAAGQSATVAESGMLKQLGGLAVGGSSILSTMWMNAMGMIDGVLAHAAAGEVGGAVASGSILGLIPVTLMLFAAMLMFKGSKQSSDEKAQAFQAQRSQQGVAESLTKNRNLSPETKKYIQNHKWKLTTVDPMSLDIDSFDDPFNRVIDIDTEHSVNFKDPVIVHGNGTTIIDGVHRVYQAQRQGLKKIPAYVPVEQDLVEGLNEFAPPGGDDGDDGFSEETLKLMAAQWWNGDQDPGIEKTLAAAGWEIGQDEGYDNGGVFVVQAGDINGNSYISWPAEELEGLAENNLHKWFKEKWVRFGPDGKIRGDCARGDDSEGKPKCLPQAKAHALGKKGRATAAARKRRQDPNPERQGAAINVATKKKTNEQVCPECGGAMYPDTMINEKKDACYYKVKSRYKVWPSAYASGALVKCRKKGAKNWGTKSESAEQRFSEPLTGYHIIYRKTGNPVINTPSFETKDQAQKYLMTKMFANHQDYKVVHTADVGLKENWSEKYKRSINCNNPKGFSQRAHCQGRKKNEAIDPAQPGTNTMSRTEMIRALHQAHGWGTAELNLASDAELKAEYSKLQNQATKEDVEYTRDPELYRSKEKARQHYTSVSPKDAFDKLTQRRLDHAEHDDRAQDKKIAELSAALSEIEAEMAKIKAAKNPQPVPETKAKVRTWADVLQEAEQRFKHKQIMEGGNLGSHKDDGTPMPGWKGVPGKHQAQTIDLKVHNRGFIVPVLNNLLLAINNSFRISQGIELWSPNNLKSRKFLSGSSLHFFNTDISDEEFTRLKPKVGDIDTQINKDAEPQIAAWLNDSVGKVIGNGKLIGFSKGNEQFSSMWELTDPPIKVQIDLEFVDYTEKGEPTDWAGFSHSSSWEDLNQGIKGVFHKFIIQSLAKLTVQDFLLRKLVGRGKARTEQDVPTTDSMLSFAVSSKEGGGLRPKYEPAVDAKGRPVVVDGMPVMKALPAAGYVKDIASIFQSIFDKRINKATLKKVLPKTWSFVGILDIMNLVLNQDEKQQVLNAFIEKLFAPGAQGLYKGDPQRDLSEKNAALNYALKVLKIKAPENLEQMRQDYVANYKVVSEQAVEKKTLEDTEPQVKAQLRKGMPHLRDLKPADFLDLIDELKTAGGKFKLQNIPLNVKIDGLGARFGKNAQGNPFMGTSRTEPRYTANFLDYHKEKGTTDPEMLNRAANYDKLFNEMMVAIEVIDLKLGANFLINKQVTCEVLYLPFASETPEGKLKFVGIEYDQLPQGVDLVIVPYRITDSTTGQDIPNTDAALQKIANLGQQGNTMFMSNRLVQKGALDVTEIINLVDNLDELKQIVSATAGKRDRASLALRREVETKLKSVQIALEKAIDEDPKILGKTKLGQDYEGIVINSRLGPIKVTSQRQKDIIAAKNAARASQGTQSNKTAVVAIGSFVGHKGHQQLWNYTQQRAEQLGGDPYLFMGNAVGKDDPIPVADKIKTWHQMYPQYKNNISAVTQEGGTLMQKIKHELINPMPGKPPRYDNIVIMVGEDQAKMPIAQALMKAVNKFPGYEHVKVSLEATPRGTGMSFTQLRNALKQGTPAEQFNVWNNAFNDPEFGAKPLPKSWIEHLMTVSKQGMGLKEGTLKTLNHLIKEGLQAIQWKN